MKQVVRIAGVRGNKLVEATITELVSCGQGMSKRPRNFTQQPDGSWRGTIHYGESYNYCVQAEVSLVEAHQLANGFDWVVLSTEQHDNGRFAISRKRAASLLPRWYQANHARPLVLVDGHNKEHTPSNAANRLAAELTFEGMFRPDFLEFPKGFEGEHFSSLSSWVDQRVPIYMASGCCLNADEERTGIVDCFDPDITDLLCRTAKAAFDALPGIAEWWIYTFGPDDFDFLGELGISKVLLPYMWDAPRNKVRADMGKNLELMQALGAKLQDCLPFPVHVGQLSERSEKVDIPWLVQESRKRAEIMLPELTAHPPLIFKKLTPEERVDRTQQEAFLYLLDTVRLGQLEGEDRDKVVYVGMEVHGGYWQQGDLFRGPRGEFLPLAWFPQCVRQHWGPWVAKNATLKRERERLGHMLRGMGY